jgi:hypothetical protein
MVLRPWPEGMEVYRAKKNKTSIDGIAGLRSVGDDEP